MDLYMKMLTITAEHKISMTDLCLYLIMNSNIPNGNFNFRNGGLLYSNSDKEIEHLKMNIERTKELFNKSVQEKEKLEYALEQVLKEKESYEKYMEGRHQEIRNENKRLKEQMKHWETYGYPKNKLPNSDKEKK
jgi:hypothetical protein